MPKMRSPEHIFSTSFKDSLVSLTWPFENTNDKKSVRKCSADRRLKSVHLLVGERSQTCLLMSDLGEVTLSVWEICHSSEESTLYFILLELRENISSGDSINSQLKTWEN